MAVRRSTLLAAVLSAVLAVLAPVGPAAAAQPPDPHTDPFFAAPAGLAGLAPGTVIRTRPVTTKLIPGVPLGTTSFQILVRSNDAKDQPAAVAATVIQPRVPTKQLLAYQPAIDSLGPQCNPTYTLQVGTEKEASLIQLGLQRGLTVVVPDHEGPRHAFAAGHMAGHAVLDAIRGTLNSPEAGLNGSATKVALMGYSGGAIATSWAAQLQPTYAPEINLVGFASGGTPADLEAAGDLMDGSASGGLFVGAAFGVMREYPELRTLLNDRGRAYEDQVKNQCLVQLVGSHPFASVKQISESPDPLREPVAQQVLDENKMGALAPTAPALLWHARLDELIPYRVAPVLRDAWCARGTKVKLVTNRYTEHNTGAVVWAKDVMPFLADRYAGRPLSGAC
jgi:hypothetical protein